MSTHTLQYDAKCKSCKGTGIYVGMAERDGSGVICLTCKGTGRVHCVIEYEDPEYIIERADVRRVYRVNPGICIGEKPDGSLKLEDFGGMSYRDWLNGNPFPVGSEDRLHTCPCWWYQSADYSRKPEWDECFSSFGSSFSKCARFGNKSSCWSRWDKEFGGKP